MRQVIGGLIDLLISEDTLRGAVSLGLDDAWSIGMGLGIGGEDVMDGWGRGGQYNDTTCTPQEEIKMEK